MDYVSVPYVFNFIKKFDLPCEKLTVGAKSYMNDYYLGGADCKMQWRAGLQSSCTSTLLEYQVFTFPSRSTGGLDYKKFQNNGQICMYDSWGGGEEYGMVVTDDAE